MTKREVALAKCRIAGYHQDIKNFTRTYIENKLSYSSAKEAYIQGENARAAGIKCTCSLCTCSSNTRNTKKNCEGFTCKDCISYEFNESDGINAEWHQCTNEYDKSVGEFWDNHTIDTPNTEKLCPGFCKTGKDAEAKYYT